MSDDEVEIDDLILHFETKEAFCVSTEEDEFGKEAERIFLPKSLVRKDYTTFIMPEWLAVEKELV